MLTVTHRPDRGLVAISHNGRRPIRLTIVEVHRLLRAMPTSTPAAVTLGENGAIRLTRDDLISIVRNHMTATTTEGTP